MSFPKTISERFPAARASGNTLSDTEKLRHIKLSEKTEERSCAH
jgi:hypothetical protein